MDLEDFERMRASLVSTRSIDFAVSEHLPGGEVQTLEGADAKTFLKGQDVVTRAHSVIDLETGVLIYRQDETGTAEVGSVPRKYRRLAGFAVAKAGYSSHGLIIRGTRWFIRRYLPGG